MQAPDLVDVQQLSEQTRTVVPIEYLDVMGHVNVSYVDMSTRRSAPLSAETIAITIQPIIEQQQQLKWAAPICGSMRPQAIRNCKTEFSFYSITVARNVLRCFN